MTEWKNNPVKLLHIELSSYCNAACPFCPRFLQGTMNVREDLRLNHISFNDFNNWFPPETLQQMSRILYCGTHGDPMMAKDAYEIFSHVKSINPNLWQFVHTNGGLRRKEWWEDLGKLFNKENFRVTFSIDGLEDTNHLYRRNVKWKILMRNVEAYINAGGNALWEFLVFRHNEHQIEEARKLANDLGFNDIVFKRPLGFNNLSNTGLKARGVYDKDGNLDYKMYPSTKKEYVNLPDSTHIIEDDIPEKFDIESLQKFKIDSMKKKMNTFDEYNTPIHQEHISELDNMEIHCKSHDKKHGNEVYVSSNGIVFPCCYVGTRVDSDIDLFEDIQLRQHMQSAGFNKFSLKHKPLEEIVNSGVLDRVFTNSWSRNSVKCGKLAYCAQTCGSRSEVDRIY